MNGGEKSDATKYLPLQSSVLDNYCSNTSTCNSYDYIYKMVKKTLKNWQLTAVYSLFHLFSEWWSVSMSVIAQGSCVSVLESWSLITEISASDLTGILWNGHAAVEHNRTFLFSTKCAWLLHTNWHHKQLQLPSDCVSPAPTAPCTRCTSGLCWQPHIPAQDCMPPDTCWHSSSWSLELNYHLVGFPHTKRKYLQNYIRQYKHFCIRYRVKRGQRINWILKSGDWKSLWFTITPETYNRIICLCVFEVYLTPETLLKFH